MIKPFRYYGGKSHLIPQMLRLTPNHRTYVEIFGGSAALLFAKVISEIEIYNDINHDLVNFYRVLRDNEKLEELLFKVIATPYSREEFDYCKKTLENLPPESVERAYRWFVLVSMCISGNIKSGWSYNIVPHGAACKTWSKMPERLIHLNNRIREVQIENKDFRKLIETYDSEDTFFYADPPYILETRTLSSHNVYGYEMSEQDHKDLVYIMLNSHGKFLLSGYDHPVYKPLTDSGWKKEEIPIICGVMLTERTERTEVLWYNYNMGGVIGGIKWK